MKKFFKKILFSKKNRLQILGLLRVISKQGAILKQKNATYSLWETVGVEI